MGNEQLFDTRTREKVAPYMKDDLRKVQKVTVDSWIHTVFGITSSEFQRSMENIHSSRLFHDRTVQECLNSYSCTSDEDLRCVPFVKLCNYIVDFTSNKGLTQLPSARWHSICQPCPPGRPANPRASQSGCSATARRVSATSWPCETGFQTNISYSRRSLPLRKNSNRRDPQGRRKEHRGA